MVNEVDMNIRSWRENLVSAEEEGATRSDNDEN
jgi:hypothetical protein